MDQPDWHSLGTLQGVSGYSALDGATALLIAIELRLASGSVLFSAVADDDTIAVASPAPEQRSDEAGMPLRCDDISHSEPWKQAMGLPVLWGRQMANHHGYVDGYQMEFATGDASVGRCIELVVVASALKVGTATFS